MFKQAVCAGVPRVGGEREGGKLPLKLGMINAVQFTPAQTLLPRVELRRPYCGTVPNAWRLARNLNGGRGTPGQMDRQSACLPGRRYSYAKRVKP